MVQWFFKKWSQKTKITKKDQCSESLKECVTVCWWMERAHTKFTTRLLFIVYFMMSTSCKRTRKGIGQVNRNGKIPGVKFKDKFKLELSVNFPWRFRPKPRITPTGSHKIWALAPEKVTSDALVQLRLRLNSSPGPRIEGGWNKNSVHPPASLGEGRRRRPAPLEIGLIILHRNLSSDLDKN